MNKIIYMDYKLLNLFLLVFGDKAHPEKYNKIDVYKVVWDDEGFKCSEMDLARFIFNEEAFELFTLEEMNAFGSLYANLGHIDMQFSKNLQTSA